MWLREVGSSTLVSSRMDFPLPMTSLEVGSYTPAVSRMDFPLLCRQVGTILPPEPMASDM